MLGLHWRRVVGLRRGAGALALAGVATLFLGLGAESASALTPPAPPAGSPLPPPVSVPPITTPPVPTPPISMPPLPVASPALPPITVDSGPIAAGPVEAHVEASVDPSGGQVTASADVSTPGAEAHLTTGTSGSGSGLGGQVVFTLPDGSRITVDMGEMDGAVGGAPSGRFAPGAPAGADALRRSNGDGAANGPGVGGRALWAARGGTRDERPIDGQDASARADLSARLARDSEPSVWSTLGDATARFGPWIALLVIAAALQAIAASALRDRLRRRPAY